MYTKLPNGEIIYAEDIECVVDPVNGSGGIYIGNLQASQNPLTLRRHGIKAVLTASKGIILNHSKNVVPYYLHIPGQDREGFDLSIYFPKSVNFIRQALEKTNILVHCMAGVSRSVSLVIAYLMKYKGMTYDSAYQMLRARRSIINPNKGFIKQLKKYEKECLEQKPLFTTVENSPSKYQKYEKEYQLEYEEMKKNAYQLSRIHQSPKKSTNFSQKFTNEKIAENTPLKPSLLHSTSLKYEENPQKMTYKPRERLYSDAKPSRNIFERKHQIESGLENLSSELEDKIQKIKSKYSNYLRQSPQKIPERKFNNFFDENRLKKEVKKTMFSTEKNPTYGRIRNNYERTQGLGILKLNEMKAY